MKPDEQTRTRCSECGKQMRGTADIEGRKVADYYCANCDGHGTGCQMKDQNHAFNGGCRYPMT